MAGLPWVLADPWSRGGQKALPRSPDPPSPPLPKLASHKGSCCEVPWNVPWERGWGSSSRRLDGGEVPSYLAKGPLWHPG